MLKDGIISIDRSHIDSVKENGLIVREDTVRSLFNQIRQKVREKKPKEAEGLRRQLFAIDKRAIHEIYESGFLIENLKKELAFEEELFLETAKKETPLFKQKRDVVPPEHYVSEPMRAHGNLNHLLSLQKLASDVAAGHHLPAGEFTRKKIEFMACWFPFYNGLSYDCLDELVDRLTPLECHKTKSLIKEGTPGTRLYFISKGNARVFSKNTQIRKELLTPGDIAGELTFFSNGISPATVVADKNALVHFLDISDMHRLKTDFPEIFRQLYALCLAHLATRYPDSDYTIPRFHERYQAGGVVSAKIFRNNSPFGALRGELQDISSGGFSFWTKGTRSPDVSKLKGNRIKAVLDIHSEERPWHDILWSGTIVNVEQKQGGHYSIHVKGEDGNRSVLDYMKLFQAERSA